MAPFGLGGGAFRFKPFRSTDQGKKFQEKEGGMKIIQLSETASVIKIQAQKLCEMAAHNIRNQHPSGLHL